MSLDDSEITWLVMLEIIVHALHNNYILCNDPFEYQKNKRYYNVTTFKFIKCMSYGTIICIDL